MHNAVNFLPSDAVGAIHLDVPRQQHYLVTGQGVRKLEPIMAKAVAQGYYALQRRHEKALRRRMVAIVVLVIAAVVLAVVR